MKIDILTFFPEMFAPLQHSIVKRACDCGVLDLNIKYIRDYTGPKKGLTDEKIYGGGAGMLMKPEPLFEAVRDLKKTDNCRVVITSPAGKVFNQKIAEDLSKAEQVIFICGHYEGIDQRVEDALATDVLSVGDFVLTGGEMPTMIMADSIIRLLPGALGKDESAEEESFSTDGLLEYPQYTRPPEFEGMEVPEVLLNGNHAEIAKWRRRMSLERTYDRRPDLLSKAVLSDNDKEILEEIAAARNVKSNVWITLVHYPVYNKKHEIVNTSITNLDLHDIARAARTFDLSGYFVVQPAQGQKELINTLVGHWARGFGARYNPDRHEALSRLHLVDSIQDVIDHIKKETGKTPKLIGTSAHASKEMIGFSDMSKIIKEKEEEYLIVLGTGWGLTDEMMASFDYVLRPIYGVGAYNHLSVRSAASIIMDRLLGEKD